MAHMPDIFGETLRDFRWFGEQAEHLMHPHDPPRGDHPYAQAPATTPVTLATAPAQSEGTDMSLATDAETWYGDLKNTIAEAEQKLPALIADAKKLEGNPIAEVAIAAGEHVAAAVLPPEALTFITSAAKNALDGLLGLYSPSGSPAPPAAEVPAAPAA